MVLTGWRSRYQDGAATNAGSGYKCARPRVVDIRMNGLFEARRQPARATLECGPLDGVGRGVDQREERAASHLKLWRRTIKALADYAPLAHCMPNAVGTRGFLAMPGWPYPEPSLEGDKRGDFTCLEPMKNLRTTLNSFVEFPSSQGHTWTWTKSKTGQKERGSILVLTRRRIGRW